jgi:dTDP-4-dehydrorhamnose reductase
MAAPRPAFAALSNARLAVHGIVMPDWRDALRRYVHQRLRPRVPEASEGHEGTLI